MGQYTSAPHQDVATASSGIAAGAGDHLPIGDYGGLDYRSAIRFSAPPGWSAWTGITSATLKVYISDHQHVAPKSSSIFCSRQNSSALWTKDQGSQDCESGFSGSNTTQYGDLVSTATDRVSFTSGSTANAAKTIDVTAMVRYYFSGLTSYLVFVFDNNGSSQYTELWALGKAGTTYDAILTINYADAAPPAAPTQNLPAAAAVDQPDQPTFTWTHNDPDAQNNAEVRIWDAAGTTLLYTWNPPVGSDKTLVAPLALAHGTAYQWDVRTSDAVSGYGAYSAKRTFTVKANPVVVIDAVRYMEFYNGLPRLRVKWSVTGGTQYKYRVTTASGYNSGLLTSVNQSHLLDTLALTNGTAESVTVYVETAEATAYTGSATRSFTPRWGLTTHRRDLTAAPLGWGVPQATATIPDGASLIFEYGSAATALAAPAAWYPNISSVPLAQFLYWRAWFLPNNTTGPTLDYLDIPTDNTASFVDKWGTTRDTPGLTGPWAISNEFVYGSRSVTAKVTGAGPFYCYAYKVGVKQGRSYILTGLMKSVGNSGACIELQDGAGTVLLGGGVEFPVGTLMRTSILTGDKEWFTADGRDVNRYKTPVWVASANMDVYVVLKAGGGAGSQAWFDAVKLEESTVATPWSPGAVGATVVDAGGVQVDAFKGGVFRLRGTDGAPRSVVEVGAQGLRFASDTELSSPADGVLAVDGVPIPLTTYTPPAFVPPIRRVYTSGTGVTYAIQPGCKYIEVEVVGAGGAGGGVGSTGASTGAVGGGGGGGGYAKKLFPVSVLPATCTFTVGVGSGGGTGAGVAGGASSFSGSGITTVQGNGGAGGGTASGTSAISVNGGNGGTASGGDINVTGSDGGGMVMGASGVNTSISNYGGASAFGGGVGGRLGTGVAGLQYGGGGSGANNTPSQGSGRAGGAAAGGVLIITEYY